VDYLLGEQTVSERAATRDEMVASPFVRAWALRLAAELAPVSRTPLPAIPDEPPGSSPPMLPVVDATTVAPAEPRQAEPADA
jgi:hypothetical protein